MIKITNATKQGFIPINEGGVLDLSFPESETRRGRVIDNGETCPTLDTGCQVGRIEVINDMFPGSRKPRFYGGYDTHNHKQMRMSESNGMPDTGPNRETAKRSEI